MKPLLKKALVYMNLLDPCYNMNIELSDFYNQEGVCSLEKLQIVMFVRLFSEFYKNNRDYSETLYYSKQALDFFEMSEIECQDQPGIIENGGYICRMCIEAGDSPIWDCISDIFSCKEWDVDILYGNFKTAYSNFSINESTRDIVIDYQKEIDHTMQEIDFIFQMRTIEEKLSDFDMLGFFNGPDRSHLAIEKFFLSLSDYFSYDEISSHFIIIKSKLLPIFLYHIDRKKLSKKDKKLYDMIENCTDLLCMGETTISCCNPELQYSYFAFYFPEYNGYEFSTIERFGAFCFDPRLTIIPYVINEGVTYLNNKYHFVEVSDNED